RKARVKRRLVILGIALQVSELARLPASLCFVERCIEGETMRMKVRAGAAIHGPRREMYELRVREISGFPILVFPARSYAGFHAALDLLHRLAHRRAKRRQNALVAG